VAAGSFGNSELFSEFFCIVFVLAVICVMYCRELAVVQIGTIVPLIVVFLSVFSLLSAGSRAALLLAGVASLYLVIHAMALSLASTRYLLRLALFLVAALAVGLCLGEVGNLFGLEDTIADFEKLDLSDIDLHGVISGKSINRGYVYEAGYRRLSERSWWLGYGYNLPENNSKSSGVSDDIRDFHSLYLALPILYGWVGAGAYVLLVVGTALRIYSSYFHAKHMDHYLAPVALAFAVLWGIFLIDQYKISATRNPSYFLLTWFWLGWTHSVANTWADSIWGTGALCDRVV
jgi:hypothetical protein